MKNKKRIMDSLGSIFTEEWVKKNPEFKDFNIGAEHCRRNVLWYRWGKFILLLSISILFFVSLMAMRPIINKETMSGVEVLLIILSLIMIPVMVFILSNISPGTTAMKVAKDWKEVRSRIKQTNLIFSIQRILINSDVPQDNVGLSKIREILRPAINCRFDSLLQAKKSAIAKGFPRELNRSEIMIGTIIILSKDFGLNMSFRHTEVVLMTID